MVMGAPVYVITKVLLSAVIIATVSELAKRSPLVGGLVASLPIISILALIWLYIDTADARAAADLASSILWLVLPSLVLFIALPVLVKKGWPFYPALGASMAATVIAYGLMLALLSRLGIRL